MIDRFKTVVLFCLAAVMPLLAVRPSVESFCRAPIDVVNYLPEYSRLDMVDYFDSGSTVASDSYLGNKIRLTELDSLSLSYAVDDSVKVTISLLPAAADTLIMVIKELPAPVADSSVRFYDARWQPLANPPLAMPRFSDWLIDRSKTEAVAYEIPFVMATASYSPADRRLVFVNTMAGYFDGRQRPESLAQLRDSLVYNWNGKRFAIAKP